MVVVPRLFEVLRQRILKQVEKQGKLTNYLMGRALDDRRQGLCGRGAASGTSRWTSCSAGRSGRRSRPRFGGRIKAMVSGGAPLNPDVGIFFHSLGLTLLQGYGQTEAAPVISCNRPERRPQDGHGRPAAARTPRSGSPRTARSWCSGELVMKGYWRNEAQTARDAWSTAGCTPATSAISTTRAGSSSPTARRTSSSTTRATMSRRRRSRGC